MIGLLGWIVLLLGAGLLVVPEQVPIVGQMFSVYWLRFGGGVLVLAGAFFAWVGRP